MQDIQVIARQNSEAAKRELERAPKGRYSVAEYTGLHFTKFHYADTHEAAAAIAAEINARGDSSHAKAPTQHPIATERDSLATAA